MWNWSNSSAGLFLQTGNMSEKAVGYTTIGGDLMGALAVLANVPKTVVMALLDYLHEKHGYQGIAAVLAKPAGPELAPNQLGEEELMPFPVLDACFYLFAGEKLLPAEVRVVLGRCSRTSRLSSSMRTSRVRAALPAIDLQVGAVAALPPYRQPRPRAGARAAASGRDQRRDWNKPRPPVGLMRAFEGIRILDLTHVLAGPFSTYQLALLGAEVIKIESPANPDMVRAVGADPELNARGMGLDFQTQAANKRSLTLNLADPDGAAIFRELVATAEVVVDNYQAGSLERLGLGYEALREINPGLIYCSVTGYGHTGPMAERPSYDGTIKAASGFLAAQHRALRAAEMVIGPPVFDYATGAMAAFAISAALLRRERTGEGQRLDVSMLDTALMLMSVDITNLLSSGEPADPGNVGPAGTSRIPTL